MVRFTSLSSCLRGKSRVRGLLKIRWERRIDETATSPSLCDRTKEASTKRKEAWIDPMKSTLPSMECFSFDMAHPSSLSRDLILSLPRIPRVTRSCK